MKALGRWLEDLTVGTVIEHAITRTITEGDNVQFTTMTMNVQPLHLDAQYAATTEFGEPLVNSMLTMSLLVGISVLETTHGTLIANLGIEEVSFPTPVKHGDTIHAETEVVDARPSRSRPGDGVVVFEHRAFNQRGELVCRCRRPALMRGRPR